MSDVEKSLAVTRALNEAFGVSELEDICDLTERPGSNRVFRIVVRGAPYLLRINTRRGDMARHFTCMQAAADAGLAPLVRYANAEDRLSITDFVVAVPLPSAEALVRIPRVLLRLHALPRFPCAPFNTTCTFLLNNGPMLDGFLKKFRASKVLPGNGIEELLARYQQVVAVYSHEDVEMAPSHNDLFKPDNMLFDGDRLWLVDWEAAFQNDRYADLAVVANMIVRNEREEEVFLREYFGGAPDGYQRARLYLMRQTAHMFYAMAFLSMGSESAVDAALKLVNGLPAYDDYQRRFWQREVGLAGEEAKVVYGSVHWQRLAENMRQACFDEALRIVSRG